MSSTENDSKSFVFSDDDKKDETDNDVFEDSKEDLNETGESLGFLTPKSFRSAFAAKIHESSQQKIEKRKVSPLDDDRSMKHRSMSLGARSRLPLSK